MSPIQFWRLLRALRRRHQLRSLSLLKTGPVTIAAMGSIAARSKLNSAGGVRSLSNRGLKARWLGTSSEVIGGAQFSRKAIAANGWVWQAHNDAYRANES